MDTTDHAAYMRRALALARNGWGSVHPNPMVGAVVVQRGRVVGEGYHMEYGGPHAEVHALLAAGAAARGATLYVTLEPCAHHGKTPPCTDAILAAGIRHVVYATADPTIQAHGGADALRVAGLRVQGGIEEQAARSLNAAFFHVHQHDTPYVALKLAMSLDACVAARPGARTQLTEPTAVTEAHRLRSGYDAILVGSGTALIDDPLLTVRGVPSRVPPVRIVADAGARLSLSSRLVATIAQAPLWLLCADDADAQRAVALERAGVRVLRCPRADDRLDLAAGIMLLAEQGIGTIFTEGGSTLAASMLRAGVVRRMYLFIAPVVLGAEGVPAFREPLDRRWVCTASERFGADALITLDAAAETY